MEVSRHMSMIFNHERYKLMKITGSCWKNRQIPGGLS
jgi:hypothetical protein